MDKCDSMVSEMSWEKSRYEDMWKKWFKMLMRFIKFGRNKSPEKVILEFFTTRHGVVMTFENFLTTNVSYSEYIFFLPHNCQIQDIQV